MRLVSKAKRITIFLPVACAMVISYTYSALPRITATTYLGSWKRWSLTSNKCSLQAATEAFLFLAQVRSAIDNTNRSCYSRVES
jgi:hypothetical protein